MLFDATVRRELARSFGATLVVILTIVITMFLIRTLGQAASGSVSPQDVVLLMGYTALGQLSTMLALSLFIAIVVTLGRMYRDSEMTIWLASGIGLSRFVAPVLRMSWPVLLVIALLVLLVWPWGNRASTELRDRYTQRSDLSRVTPGVFQVSRDGSRVFFVERSGDGNGAARNVFILDSSSQVESVTSARSGHLVTEGDDRVLVLDNGQRHQTDRESGERTVARFDRYRVLVGEGVAQATTGLPAKAMRTIDLIRQPTARHQGELAWRLGLLFGAGNLLLLGIGLAASNPRRPNNWNLGFALLGFVVYFNLINLSQAWVTSGRYGLGPMLLGLHGGALALALALIWWRDHGTTLSLWPARGGARA